jgi:uncharacterized protein YihD (DUF1040 family)
MSADYRTDWQRVDDQAAIDMLNRIDVEHLPMRKIHELADDVLLSRVHADVADAYARVRARAEAVPSDKLVVV